MGQGRAGGRPGLGLWGPQAAKCSGAAGAVPRAAHIEAATPGSQRDSGQAKQGRLGTQRPRQGRLWGQCGPVSLWVCLPAGLVSPPPARVVFLCKARLAETPGMPRMVFCWRNLGEELQRVQDGVCVPHGSPHPAPPACAAQPLSWEPVPWVPKRQVRASDWPCNRRDRAVPPRCLREAANRRALVGSFSRKTRPLSSFPLGVLGVVGARSTEVRVELRSTCHRWGCRGMGGLRGDHSSSFDKWFKPLSGSQVIAASCLSTLPGPAVRQGLEVYLR